MFNDRGIKRGAILILHGNEDFLSLPGFPDAKRAKLREEQQQARQSKQEEIREEFLRGIGLHGDQFKGYRRVTCERYVIGQSEVALEYNARGLIVGFKQRERSNTIKQTKRVA